MPGVGQTVVLTRTAARATPMPAGEELPRWAATGATLVLHLAVQHDRPGRRRRCCPHYGGGLPGGRGRPGQPAGRGRAARHPGRHRRAGPRRRRSAAPRSSSSARCWPPRVPRQPPVLGHPCPGAGADEEGAGHRDRRRRPGPPDGAGDHGAQPGGRLLRRSTRAPSTPGPGRLRREICERYVERAGLPDRGGAATRSATGPRRPTRAAVEAWRRRRAGCGSGCPRRAGRRRLRRLPGLGRPVALRQHPGGPRADPRARRRRVRATRSIPGISSSRRSPPATGSR